MCTLVMCVCVCVCVGYPSDGIVQPEEEEELESDDDDVSPLQGASSRHPRSSSRNYPKAPGLRSGSDEGGASFRYNYWAKEPRSGRQMNNTRRMQSRQKEARN